MNKLSKYPVLWGTAALMAASVALYGCKDFLDSAAVPQGTLDQGTLSNKAGVEGSLIATYRSLDWNNAVGGNFGTAASNWVWGDVASDDSYKGTEASDGVEVTDVELYHWSTPGAESYLNDKWRQVYDGASRANATLRLLKQVQAASPGEIPQADADGITGEATFLRAHFMFEAYRLWGNIPYYREDDTDYRKANEQGPAVITDILKDLDDAIAKLPLTPRNSQKGRVTKWTAKAYKGRVQVYAGQYAAALTTLREVRQSGPYSLEASMDKIWTGFSEADNETILAYQASANDGEPNGNNANYGERLNFPHGSSHSSCCGFHQPTQNLVNFFAVDANGLPLSQTSATWNASNATFAGGSAQAVDPRLDWTVGRHQVPYKDWGLHVPGWIRAETYGGPYSPKKNAHEISSGAESGVGWVPTQLNSINIQIFRYADMLLLLAEAEVEAGVLENARTIVNEIRTRAGKTAQGCGLPANGATAAAEVTAYPQCAGDTRIAVPINDPKITWATYKVGLYTTPFASQAVARQAVRDERRLELAMEGQRFFDLKRWGIALTTLNAYMDGVGGGSEKARRSYMSGAEAVATKHLFFPIPAVQVELSKVGGSPKLTQNPGW